MAILGGCVFLMSKVPLYLIVPISSDLAEARYSLVHDFSLLDSTSNFESRRFYPLEICFWTT